MGQHYGRNVAALRDRLLTDLPRPVELVWTDAAASREALGEQLFYSILAVLRETEDQDAGFGWDERFTVTLA